MPEAQNILLLDTTQGKVSIAMRPDLAPNHVARIKELVRDGFYDGVVFHRVIEGFMAQTGCPHGTGTGGSGRKLKAEFSKENHVRGTVSMARAQSPIPGTASSLCALPIHPGLMANIRCGARSLKEWRTLTRSSGESPLRILTVSSPPSCKRQPDRGAAGDLRPRLSRSAPVRAPRHPWRTIHAWFGRPDKR